MSADPAATAPTWVDIFDTTLRDGAQFEGISLTVEDKLRIAEQLDWLGVRYIEGGYPQANPKDEEFFRRAATELRFETAALVAFGSTRRPAGKVDVDPTLARARRGRRVDRVHRRQVVGLPRHRGAAHHPRRGRGHGRRLGAVPPRRRASGCSSTPSTSSTATRPTPSSPCACSRRRPPSGAEVLVLCDTNGGSLPHEVQRIVGEVHAYFGADQPIGIHTQNDTGCAVANSVAAVRRRRHAAAGHDQRLRRAHRQRQPHDVHPEPQAEARACACLPEGRLERLTAVSRHVAELVNLPPHDADPYVGASAFAHKGGLHTSALGKAGGATYEHVDPAVVGNHTRVLVSDLGGRAGMAMKAKEFGVELDDRAAGALTEELKRARVRGLRLRGGRRLARAADARGPPAGSSRASASRATGSRPTTATIGRRRPRRPSRCGSATTRRIAVGEGNGPVNALDAALRTALERVATRRSSTSTSPTTRCASSTTTPTPTPSSGCSSSRPTASEMWTTIGVEHEHHRGVVAGPHRLPRLRPARASEK